MKPNNITPASVTTVWISPPSERSYTEEMFPVATFVYEEKGHLKAWCGYKKEDLSKIVLVQRHCLEGKDHTVFRGYIAPLAFLYLTLYDDDFEIKHNSLGTERVQLNAFELAQAASRLQRKAQYYLDHREAIDAQRRACKEAAKKHSAPAQTSGPSEAEVYPNRGGYVGD